MWVRDGCGLEVWVTRVWVKGVLVYLVVVLGLSGGQGYKVGVG